MMLAKMLVLQQRLQFEQEQLDKVELKRVPGGRV